MTDLDRKRLGEIVQEMKRLATEYYKITGRPIGITGEIAEYEAIAALKLEPAKVRQAGYDAVDAAGGRVQIKGRCLSCDSRKKSQRCGAFKGENWDYGVFVLLDEHFQALGIWKAPKDKILGAMRHSRRSDMPVKRFQRLAENVWSPPSEHAPEPDMESDP